MAKPKRDGLELKIRHMDTDEIKSALTGAQLRLIDYLRDSNDPEMVMKVVYAFNNTIGTYLKVLDYSDMTKRVEQLEDTVRQMREANR